MPHIAVIDITPTEKNVPDMLFEVNDAFLEMVKKEKKIEISKSIRAALVNKIR